MSEAYKSLIDAYIETLLWSSTDDDGTPIDRKYGIRHINTDDRDKIESDIKKFESLVDASVIGTFENINDLTGNDYSRIMHDFVLTCNGHGAGFWDGDYDVNILDDSNNILCNIGDKLTELCKQFNTVDMYIGDDGNLYMWDS